MLKVADVVREITHTSTNKQASEEQYQPFPEKNRGILIIYTPGVKNI
jgi:hypothetical protein